MRRWHGAAIAIATAATMAGCSGRASGARDVRADLAMTLDATGSADVRETWTARFAPGSTRFAIRIPADFTDGLSNLTAIGDGGGDGLNGGAGRAEIPCARGCELTWTFAPDNGRVHVFNVSYHVRGVLATTESHGSLRWPLLPPDRGFTIARAVAHLVAPAVVFTGRAGIEPDRGWTLTRSAGGLEADHTDIRPGDDVTLVAEFVIDPDKVAEPAWQEDAQEGETLGPSFVAGGLALASVGVGVLWLVGWQYPPRRGSALTEPDRRMVKRGLIGGGIAVVVLGAICAAVVPLVLGRYGPWPYCVPAGTVVAGVLMVGWALRY